MISPKSVVEESIRATVHHSGISKRQAKNIRSLRASLTRIRFIGRGLCFRGRVCSWLVTRRRASGQAFPTRGWERENHLITQMAIE